MNLTSAERSRLRSEAHALNPVVMIGEAGLTPAVMKEIDANLNAHGLIKVRVAGDDREERIAIYETICEELDAAPVQHIGKLLVIYRPKKETRKEADEKRGRGMREVTIVKPSRSGLQKPTVTRVLLKGNERVTAGGSIKRAKPRKTSIKKTFGGRG
jgi:putative YhbY family RNA-binding protein